MRLVDIEAQEAAIRALLSSIRRSSVAHAYLFTGPRGTGKTAAAVAFAASLNCTDPTPEGDACGLCLPCIRIAGGTDPDVRVISPDGNQTKIEQMQEMIRSLGFAPLSGRYKVFIIEQADTLNPSSENCILKILEEPPAYAMLTLLSANPNSLLPTIRSRCRRVRFRRAGTPEVEAALRKRRNLPEEDVRVIAVCSQGAVGRALTMASAPEFMEERRAVLQALRNWTAGPPVMSLQTAETLRRMATPPKNTPSARTLLRNLTDMLEHILSWHADMLAMKIRGSETRIANVDCLDDLTALSHRYSTQQLRDAIRSITATRRHLEGNITPQLALENMLFDLHPESIRVG